MDILIATVIVGVIGLLIGIALVGAGKKFYVEVDERETEVRERLPGNNCGACGFAGCDAMAAAIVKGDAAVNACPVCSPDAVAAIGEVMGVSVEASARKVAFVRCAGTCENSPKPVEYFGIDDCRAVALAGVKTRACTHGCLGLGSCVTACPQEAIRIQDGVAVVYQKLCVGCGLCAQACPKGLIELIPVGKAMAVRCSSKDKGAAVRKVCTAGCIGCGVCAKQCEHDAITVAGNLAHIDSGKCVGCGKCAEKCPRNAIIPATKAAVAAAVS